MSVDNTYTDRQRESFQERLRKRADKMALGRFDQGNRLEDFFEGVGYYYAAGLNFGKFFRNPDKSPLIGEFQEAMDNADAGTTEVALVFSRPQDVIYIMVDPVLYWVSHLRPLLVFETKALGLMAIAKLEDFLEEMP